MTKKEAEELIQKYHNGKCSIEEIQFLEDWYQQWNDNTPPLLSESELEEELELIKSNLPGDFTVRDRKIRSIRPWHWFTAACVVIGILASGVILLNHLTDRQTNLANDVLPGQNQAILTLSNGKKVILGTGSNKKIAEESKVIVNQQANSRVVYSSDGLDSEPAVYNTLSTPRGGQFQLILADGTKVWLNAASSIRFPNKFVGAERRVDVTGEVYFEVLHNAKLPFKVFTKGQVIEDIGTHFNVNCYSDEPYMATTLVEGRVKVYAKNNSVILNPGQQSQIHNGDNNEKIDVLNNVDLQQTIAWKNGAFVFHEASVENVMRQISRWYNVDVSYSNGIPDKTLSGVVSRTMSLSHVLDILHFFKIDYSLTKSGDKQQIIINNN